MIVAFGVILSLSVWYIYTSVRLDVGILPEAGAKWARGLRERMRRGFRDERRELHSTHSLQGKLAVFLGFAFVFGWIVLSWDLSMSLDPHFQSTMYGWWFFMGGWVAALASWTIIVMAWRRFLGRYDLIQDKHFHDLGKLCFAFTAFWGYLTFGQYLVIWYGNLGEETHWMRLRLIQPWEGLTLTTVGLMFVLPFFGLLSRAAKVFLPTMVLFASSTIFGLWLHRYLEVYPSVYGTASRSAIRSLGDCDRARLPRRVGLLLSLVHGCIPAHAGAAHDVALPRRGAGAGGPAHDGAAAGARIESPATEEYTVRGCRDA